MRIPPPGREAARATGARSHGQRVPRTMRERLARTLEADPAALLALASHLAEARRQLAGERIGARTHRTGAAATGCLASTPDLVRSDVVRSHVRPAPQVATPTSRLLP